jgi:hypothetical protein
MHGLGLAALSRSVSVSWSPTVALIDGTVDTTHTALAGASIRMQASDRSGRASDHTTAMASVVVGSDPALGACREARLLVLDVVDDALLCGFVSPSETAIRIARQILAACAQSVQIIILGFELLQDAPSFVAPLLAALENVRARGGAVFVPAGNEWRCGNHPFLLHPNVFPVASGTDEGLLGAATSWGPALASGFLAPAYAIPVAGRDGKVRLLHGSSFAAALAASACAALHARLPQMSAAAICHAMRKVMQHRSRTVPPAINAWLTYRAIGGDRSPSSDRPLTGYVS